jgi:hypothetical protein
LAEHSVEKRPHFLPRLGELRVACEVEQFKPGASALERRLTDQPSAFTVVSGLSS